MKPAQLFFRADSCGGVHAPDIRVKEFVGTFEKIAKKSFLNVPKNVLTLFGEIDIL